MPKPKVVIDGFSQGIMDDITQPVRNGFSFGAGIDLQKAPGILQVSQSLDAMTEAAATNNITTAVCSQVRYSVMDKVFASSLGSPRVYAYNLGQGDKWSLVYVNSQACSGATELIEFNGDMYMATNAALTKFTSNTIAEDLDDNETTIDITDSTVFGATGSIIIGSEVITYTGNAANQLTGCTRGAYGSTAATHTNGDTVYGFHDDYKTIDSDTSFHPMIIFGDYLVIGCGRYIDHMTTGGTLTTTAVDLPLGYKIRCMAIYGNKLYLGTWKGATIYEQPEAKLFSCTMSQMLAGTFEEVLSMKECGIHALTLWKNNLIIFAGITGNIYAYNGATLTHIKSLPRINVNFGHWGQICPNAVAEYNGNLVFGFSTSTADYGGIYMLDKNNLALTSSHIVSTGAIAALSIYSIFQASTNIFYVGAAEGSNYFIDTINTANRIASTAFWESQIYDIEQGGESASVNGIELVAKPMSASTSVKIEYKLDNASSWSDWVTVTSANQVTPIWLAIGAGKTIQIRLEFTCATKYSPEILAIKIY